jgi:predicted nucleic acid-binding protein
MNYLLDTNALSEINKPKPNEGFMEWFKEVNISDVYASCITFGEIYKGIELLSDSPKRKQLEKSTTDILESFNGRVLLVDLDTTLLWAKLIAQSIKKGLLAPAIDTLIAAQCVQHQMTIITRNIRDFEQFSNLAIICPWSKN